MGLFSSSNMQSDDPVRRAKAAAKLGASRDPAAVPALAAALNDVDVQVRRAAAAALGEIGGAEAIAALVAALWDRRSFVQYEATAALTKIGLPAAAYVMSGLTSPDQGVRDTAAMLVRQIAGEQALAAAQAGLAAIAATQQVTSPAPQDEDTEDPDDDRRGEPEESFAATQSATELERLIAALSSHERRARRAAAKALCESADSKWWEALVEAGAGRDEEVVRYTATALSKLCRHGDIRDIRPTVATKVIEQLSDVSGEHAIEVFRRALGHVYPNVRSKAYHVLDSRAEQPTDDEERRFRALITEDWDALRKLKPGSIPELLIAQLQSDDRHNRADAAEQLGKIADGRAIEPLIAALNDDEEERVRGMAATALSLIPDPRAVDPLILRLRDRDEWVRCRAADALAVLADQRALEPLAAGMKGLDKKVRQSAARAIGRIGGGASVAMMGEALRDADVEVRRIAVAALAGIGSPEASSHLAAAMSDDDDEVRAVAARGLGGGGGELSTSQTAALLAAMHSAGRGARKAAAEALQARGWQPGDDEQRAMLLVAMENPLGAEEFGEAAVDALCLALLDGGHYYLCQTAAECLGRILDTRAVRPLCVAVRDCDDMTVRGAAATALGRIRDRAAVPALVGAMEGESEQWARPYIATALGKIGGPATAAALKAAVQTADEKTQSAVLEALNATSANTDPDRLVAALGDDEPKVQLRAAVLLARRGDPRGAQWMEQASRSNDTLLREKAIAALRQVGGATAIRGLISRVKAGGFDASNEAVNALVELGDPAVAPMVEALVGMDHNARWVMITGLARMGVPAMSPLCASLPAGPKELKKTACEVLGRMYDNEDVTHKPVEPLITLLTDSDAEVRRFAAHGLDLLKWQPESAELKTLLERGQGR
ncbi:MAG: lyase domain protein repeat-containing protein [Phycisphaerales bacterium]|nr:lyase domain protein repeat-containing protein [Phycisphaerales bacterium]